MPVSNLSTDGLIVILERTTTVNMRRVISYLFMVSSASTRGGYLVYGLMYDSLRVLIPSNAYFSRQISTLFGWVPLTFGMGGISG